MFNHQALRRDFEAAERDRIRTGGHQNAWLLEMKEELAAGRAKAEDFSIRELFEEFVEDGRAIVKSFNPRFQGHGVALLEDGAVNTGNFANITGQIVYSRVMDAYNAPGFIGDELFETIPTVFEFEKVPGISQIGDEAESIGEGRPYPRAGIGEEWVQTPETIKRGFIVEVTKEAVFFDRTGILLKRASDVATWVRVNKEKRQLDVALGITTTYRRNGAAAIATYQTSTPYINSQTGNALTDWTSVQSAWLLFDGMTDPNTGEPIIVMPDVIVCPSALRMTSDRVIHATEILYGNGGITSASTLTRAGNPIPGGVMKNLRTLSSPYVQQRTSSTTAWFLGQAKKGFAYMENWPITVTQAPANNEAEFTADIVARWKVSERGAAAVLDPRFFTKNTP